MHRPTVSPAPLVQRHEIGWSPNGSAWERFRHELGKVDSTSVALFSADQRDQHASVGVVRLGDFAAAHGELPSVRVLKEELGDTVALYLRENTPWSVQHGRSEITHRRDEMVVATSGTHQALSTERGRTTGLWVPFDRLSLARNDLRRLLMQSIPLSAPLRRLLSTSSVELVNAGAADPLGTEHYLAGLADLVLRSILGLDPDHALTRQARREQIVEAIQGQLADSELTVDDIAAQHHMSRTKLYQIFGGDGVASFIRRARLERAMQLLTDPLHAGQSIGAISHQAGFTNQAHFTRLFRSEFGASPGEFRRAQQYGAERISDNR